MHEKLIKQLRNNGHCSECPYDEDCDEFDSCLMDLLAADAIEDMSKRLERQEKELREKENIIDDLLDKFNSIGCTSFYLSTEEIQNLKENGELRPYDHIWDMYIDEFEDEEIT